MAYPYYQSYQPYYQQPPMQDNLAQLRSGYLPAQMQNPILWVGSEAEADQYPVAPNNAVVLWDSNAPKVYLKQSDASGRVTKKTYRLTEETAPAQILPPSSVCSAEYVTRKEFEAAIAELRKEPEHEPTV